MKTKFIKSRLNDELSAKAPDVLDSVRRTSDIDITPMENVKRAPLYKKWAPALIAACLVLAITIGAVALINSTKGPDAHPTVYANYFCLDINPSVEFVVDDNRRIVSVKANNEEGEIVLKNLKEDVKGMAVFNAVQAVAASAAELGYLDVSADAAEPNVIKITSFEDSESEGSGKAIVSTVQSALSVYCYEKNILSVYASEILTKEKLYERAREYDVNVTLNDENGSLLAVLANREEYYKKDIKRLTSGSAEGIIVGTLYKINELKDFVRYAEQRKAVLSKLYELNDDIQASYHLSGFALLAKVEYQSEEERTAAAEFKDALDKCNVLLNGSVNSITLNLYYNAYASVDIDSLYSVLLTIEQKLYDSQETVAAIGDRIDSFVDTLTAVFSSWSTELSSLLSDAPSTVAEYETYIVEHTSEKAVELKAAYVAKFSAERAKPTAEEYNAMSEDIIERFGSFEAYFEWKKTQKNY